MTHTPTPWSRNNRFEIGPRFDTDDQSDGMLDPIMDVWVGDNREADAAFVLKAVNSYEALVKALRELHAMVMGECPSLLNEDSGGNANLDLEIRDLIA